MAKRRDADRKGSVTKVDPLVIVLQTMNSESERGCLLVGLSEIDNRMEELLMYALTRHGESSNAKWLLDAKSGGRPLGTLAVRTRIARSLGLIGDELEKIIDELRGIRNTHAHGTLPLRLTTKDLAGVVESLPAEFRKNLEGRLLKEYKPKMPRVKKTLAIILSFVSACLGRRLTEIKDYDTSLERLVKVAIDVTGVGKNEHNQPSIKR